MQLIEALMVLCLEARLEKVSKQGVVSQATGDAFEEQIALPRFVDPVMGIRLLENLLAALGGDGSQQ